MAVTDIMDVAEAWWPEAHVDPSKMAALTLAAHRHGGLENVGVPFCMTVEAEAMGARIDLGSRENEPKVIAYAINSLQESGKLAKIDTATGRPKVCIDAIRILKEEAPQIPKIASLTGPVSLATSLLDPLIFYRTVITKRELTHTLMEIGEQTLIKFGSAMIEAGADVVCIADPSASGEILGKRPFAEFALPYLNRLAEYFRRTYGVPTIVHICGDVRTLGSLLAEINAESISVDSIVSLKKLRELAPESIAMGNVSTYLLEKGRSQLVKKSAERCIRNGTGILAPACGISPRTPLANINALSESVKT